MMARQKVMAISLKLSAHLEEAVLGQSLGHGQDLDQDRKMNLRDLHLITQ
jgi:hypothetical protein